MSVGGERHIQCKARRTCSVSLVIQTANLDPFLYPSSTSPRATASTCAYSTTTHTTTVRKGDEKVVKRRKNSWKTNQEKKTEKKGVMRNVGALLE